MTDALLDKLNAVLSGVTTRVNLSEAETEEYPYVVFDITSSPLRDKAGVWGFSGDTKIRIVGDDIFNVEPLLDDIEDAISSEMSDGVFSSKLIDTSKECVDGIWTIELNYTLKQYADWAPTVEQTNE